MSSITGGDMTVEEAQDLANILKAGKLPAPARIVAGRSCRTDHSDRNPSMPVFSPSSSHSSVYFSICPSITAGAGHVADIALFANVFFLFGVLASIGAVLTLPGIAGIVLTLAMAVDSNVIIYERMREEIRAGKGMRLVVKDGFTMPCPPSSTATSPPSLPVSCFISSDPARFRVLPPPSSLVFSFHSSPPSLSHVFALNGCSTGT